MLHSLDDFIIIGSPDTDDCQRFVEVMDGECAVLGIPVADHKKATRLTFLGIEIDTVKRVMRRSIDTNVEAHIKNDYTNTKLYEVSSWPSSIGGEILTPCFCVFWLIKFV